MQSDNKTAAVVKDTCYAGQRGKKNKTTKLPDNTPINPTAKVPNMHPLSSTNMNLMKCDKAKNIPNIFLP